jgi:hypothetical protein
MVAGTLGVTEGLISQYLADSKFAEEVTKLKLGHLQKQSSVDNKYLDAEDRLLDKLLKTIPLITKPMDILRGLQVVNASKRRGMADGGASGAGITQIVQINLPPAISAKFISNTNNQIVEIQDDEGARSLITSSSDEVAKFAHGISGDSIGNSVEQALNALGNAAAAASVSGESNRGASYLIEQASQRINQRSIAEAPSKGLRRSIEAKAAITADDL